MVTRNDYRTDLNHKLLALEDGGYGDFEYDTTDLNLFLSISVARLYPSVYKKLSESKTLVDYGTRSLSYITPTMPERVYLIEDSTERQWLSGWQVSGTSIINIDKYALATAAITTVTVYYHDAFTLPNDDTTDCGISAVYQPLVVLGAQIEALESRQDTGVRGDPAPQGQFPETQLLDRLIPRYTKMREDLSMSLPAVRL